MSQDRPSRFRRYTNLPILIDMLRNERITIIGYGSWIDANDKYAMDLYKSGDPELMFLGAFCVASASSETFHHWKVFADGPSGVCVVFNGAKFLEFAAKLPANCYECRPVQYVPYKSNQVEQDNRLSGAFEGVSRKNLPFVKRRGFSDEEEYRIVYESKEGLMQSHHMPIDLSMIEKVTLSPFLHDELVDGVKETLRSIPGWARKVTKARMTDNKTWQRSLDRYAQLALGASNA